MMRITSTIAAAGLAMALVSSGCAASRSSTPPTPTASDTAPSSTAPVATAAPAPTTTLPGAVDPNAPEIVEPGDIPDNQVFIPFTASNGLYSVKVPEGWARTEAAGVVTFTDKYNSIALRSSAATTTPTVDSVRANGLADVGSDPTFTLFEIKLVTRKPGVAVQAQYEIGSAPNPVTGKKALLAVQRYVFFHNGTLVTMTLSGAKGADNVDPWRIVSDSLAWK